MRVKGKAAWINFAALILVNLMWAAQYPAYKIAGDSMGAAALNFWMLMFALVLLIPLWLRERRKSKSEPMHLDWKIVREYLVLGLVGIIPPSVMLSWGIAHSSASNAAILSLTIPVLMTALGFLMLKEKFTLIRVLCLCLGLIGTLLVSTSDLAQASLRRSLLLGNLVILIAGAGSAFYNTYSKDLLSRYSELEVLIYSYVVATVGCAAISLVFEPRPFYRITGYSGATWLAIAVLGILSWGLAMILWMWVLNRLEVGQISTSIYLLPLFGLILSVLTVHDRISLPQVLGGVLTVVGTATLTLFEGRRSAQVAESHSICFWKGQMSVCTLIDDGNPCGEAPIWDATQQCLYWTDCAGKFYRYDWKTRQRDIVLENFEVTGCALDDSGGFTFINSGGVWFWNRKDKPSLIVSEIGGVKLQLNDCIADPEGRLLAGSCFYDPQTKYSLGKLFTVQTNGTVQILDEGIHLANGLGFSPDRKTLYFADSVARLIYEYEYDVAAGRVKNRRVFVKVDSSSGLPDGLTVDAQGFVWSAEWYGGCICRYDPDGQLERRIQIPAKQTSSLAFGGPQLNDIFVTSAAKSEPMPVMPPGYDLVSGYCGGGLFHLNAGIAGTVEYRTKMGHLITPRVSL